MPKLFGVDFEAVMAKELGPRLIPAILIKYAYVVRVDGALTAGRPRTGTSHNGRGVIQDYTDEQKKNTLILKEDRLALLLSGTFTSGVKPEAGDEITIEEKTYSVVAVARDPAGATYLCQVRS